MNACSLRKVLLLLLSASLLAAGPVFAGATITIVNGNAPGVGFNDPTPVAPVGGNSGTTLGQQRLNAFQFAANVWGSTLDSNVEIQILATFEPLSCTATSAVLGSAGTRFIWTNFPGISPFPGAEFDDTWYHQALANKRAGFQLNTDTDHADIRARFNSNLGNVGCLTGIGWYLGFDDSHGTQIDLVTVLEHEFAHGLGFAQFASVTTGSEIAGLTDIFGRHILDNTTTKHWNEMSNAERVASAINPRRVVWDGASVTGSVPAVLALGTPLLHVSSPAAIVGNYAVGSASFGPPLSSPGITGAVVQALDPADGAGPSTFDACSPLTNAAAVTGNIALVDRGTCGFIVKVKNAQNAGAIAVLVADNVAGAPPAGLGGADPTITIPSVRISLADGNTIKAQLGAGVNATLGVDLSVRAGADAAGRALLYTPNPVQPGSTISHWDTIAFPNQLMEPAINADLTHSVKPPEDLTLPQMRDVGWFPDADLDGVPDDVDCEPHSDFAPTVVIGGCDSGVPNTFFTTGCTISDLVHHCAAAARNHGAFASCVAHLGNDLLNAGIITGAQKDAIQSCAGRARIP
jgi:PA domain-containing protein